MKPIVLSLTISIVTFFVGCSTEPKSPPVADNIRKSLDQPAFKNVSVSQDREKGVVTLTGHVATGAEKTEAEAIARSNAEGQVVADQIAVLPPGDASAAKTIDSDLDKAIEKNLDALKAGNRFE
jgi:osmotically-inducible protein OsmY